MNMYEAVFIMVPGLEKEAQETAVEDIKNIVTKFGGTVDRTQTWGKKRLAYPIKKQNEGIYYVLDLSVPPESVIKLEAQFKLNESFLRVMIVKREMAVPTQPAQDA